MSTRTATVVRASSLSGYGDCQRRSAARMFTAEVEAAGFELRELPNNVGAAVGTGVHGGAAVLLKEKAATGALPPLDVATDAAIAELRKAAEPGITYDNETPALNDAEKQTVRMVHVYAAQVAPKVQPLAVEQRLEAVVTPNIVLSGQSDVIAAEPGRIRDLKGGKTMGSHGPQVGAYSLLARSHEIVIDIKDAIIDWVPRVSLRKPQPPARSKHYDVAIAETAAVNVLRHIEDDLEVFRNGNAEGDVLPGDPWAFLANSSSKLCSDRWCPAWGTAFCREHDTEE